MDGSVWPLGIGQIHHSPRYRRRICAGPQLSSASPLTGPIRVDGSTLVDSSQEFVCFAPARRAMPLAPQHPSLFPNWNVCGKPGDAAQRNSRDKERDREDSRCSLFPPCASAQTSVPQISPAARPSASIWHGRSVRAAGGLLLLDEPFNGMDVALRDEIIRDMQVCSEERTILRFSP